MDKPMRNTMGFTLFAGIYVAFFIGSASHHESIVPNKLSVEYETTYQGKPASYWKDRIRVEITTPDNHTIFSVANDPAAIQLLGKLLSDADPSIRIYAVQSLYSMSREVLGPLVPELRLAMNDSNCLVRSYATLAFSKANSETQGTISLLIYALSDQEICVRISAIEALALVEPKATSAIPALVSALRDEDSYVRIKAAEALYLITRQTHLTIPILIQGLKDVNVTRRVGAALALKRMGRDATLAVPALTQALGDEEMMVDAADALAAIGSDAKPAFHVLLHLVKVRRSQGKPFWWARDAMMNIDATATAQAGVPEDR